MGKSLDYIKQRVQGKENVSLNLDFEQAFEFSPKQYLKMDENDRLTIQWTDDDANSNADISVEVNYDPNAKFEYFTMSSCCHDGTLLFSLECITECLKKILGVQTYNKKVGLPSDPAHADYFYTIGDIVMVHEYGDQFATAEKPWMKSRTTVLIPIVYRYKEK